MDQDFVRLGAELKAARNQRRPKLAQDAAAKALDVGRSTIQKIERGEGKHVTITTVRAYARLLGWTDDSVDRVLAGGAPAIRTTAPEEGAGEDLPLERLGLTPAVAYELRSGKTVDSQVFNLGPDDDDGHLIVVVQTKKSATPEEVERVISRYRDPRRYLQSVASEPDEVADS